MKRLLFLFPLLLLLGCERHAPDQSGGYADAMKAIGQGTPVMLEVGADYCTACQDMKALIETIRNEHPDIAIHMINANQEREAAGRLGVRMIPTQIIYDGNGHEVFRHVGGYGEAAFRTMLKEHRLIKE